MESSSRKELGVPVGNMRVVSTQLGNMTLRAGGKPFSPSRPIIFGEIVETRSKPIIDCRSTAAIRLRRTVDFSIPVANPASISKSWMCSQLEAPESHAVMSPAGTQKAVGSTTKTKEGRQKIWRSITGKLESAKLDRCRIRRKAEGFRETHNGQR